MGLVLTTVRDLLRGPYGWLASSTLILLKPRQEAEYNLFASDFHDFHRTSAKLFHRHNYNINILCTIWIIFSKILNLLNFTRDYKQELKDFRVQTCNFPTVIKFYHSLSLSLRMNSSFDKSSMSSPFRWIARSIVRISIRVYTQQCTDRRRVTLETREFDTRIVVC